MVVQLDLGFVGLAFRFVCFAFGLRFDPGFCGVTCGFVDSLMVGPLVFDLLAVMSCVVGGFGDCVCFAGLWIDVGWYDIVSCGLGGLGLVILFGGIYTDSVL